MVMLVFNPGRFIPNFVPCDHGIKGSRKVFIYHQYASHMKINSCIMWLIICQCFPERESFHLGDKGHHLTLILCLSWGWVLSFCVTADQSLRKTSKAVSLVMHGAATPGVYIQLVWHSGTGQRLTQSESDPQTALHMPAAVWGTDSQECLWDHSLCRRRVVLQLGD